MPLPNTDLKSLEMLRNCSRLKEAQGTRRLNATRDPGTGKKKKRNRHKDVIATTNDIQIWTVDLITILNQC